MAKPRTLLALSFLAFLASSALAHAQGLLPDTAAKGRSLAGEEGSLLPLRGTFVAVEQTIVPAIVPFEQPASAHRLVGEDDTARFTFSLSSAQASGGGTLDLSYRNAVSVLPDTSVLDVMVNGVAVASVPIVSPMGFKKEALPLSAEHLKEGRNEVRLRARQSHRVDCSLQATYELWTELDPSTTGFSAKRNTTFSDLRDLASVGRTPKGVTDIRLILPEPVTAEMLNEAAPVLQTLALFLNREDVVVSVADRAGEGPGIDLVIATDRMRNNRGEAGSLVAAAPYGFSVRGAPEPHRAVVVLRAASREEVTRQLLEAIRGPLDGGLQSGIFAGKTGTIIAEASHTYTLAETGYKTEVFTGSLSRTAFNLVMPADFYPAEYATIDLHLSAATSPGLKQTSQFLVRVNDRVVKSYPFRNRDGEEFAGKRIELPLRAFRPGANKVELLAEVPVDADDVCAPAARQEALPRFLLLDNTQIVIPALARIGRLPDLAAFSGRAYPYANGRPFDLFIDRPDGQSLGAALTVLSRLALSARNPLDATIVLSPADPATGRDALVITADKSFAEIGRTAKGEFPAVANASASAIDAMLRLDPITTAGIGALSIAADAQAEAARPDDPDALLRAFQQSTAGSAEGLSFSTRLRQWVSGTSGRFGTWLSFGSAEQRLGAGQSGPSLISVSQQQSPDGYSTWTVIRAGSPRDLALGTSRLVDPALWNSLEGGSVEVAANGLSLVSQPAVSSYISGFPDQSIGNIRRVAAAWLSENFQFYVVAIVVLMGAFAVWLGRLVPRKGVRTDQ